MKTDSFHPRLSGVILAAVPGGVAVTHSRGRSADGTSATDATNVKNCYMFFFKPA